MKQPQSLIACNLAWFMARHKTNSHALAEALARGAKPRGDRPATQATIFRILSGASRDPRTSTLQPLADFFGVSVSALREHDFQKSGLSDDGNTSSLSDVQPQIKGYPLLPWEQVTMGITKGSRKESRGRRDTAQPYRKDLGPRGYCLRVKGAAMVAQAGNWPSFPDGMILYVNPELAWRPGHFVIVRRAASRQAIFRRLIDEGGELYLEALNPSWPERYLKVAPGDRFCGVVVHAGVALV